nr:MAG TPA: hypothetical protein [Caudoviricetes sp.]
MFSYTISGTYLVLYKELIRLHPYFLLERISSSIYFSLYYQFFGLPLVSIFVINWLKHTKTLSHKMKFNCNKNVITKVLTFFYLCSIICI